MELDPKEEETTNLAQMLNNINKIDTPKFKDKAHQELFHQYQIANTVETENFPDCPMEVFYLRRQQD